VTGGDQARAEGAELRESLAKATPGPWRTYEAHGRDFTDEGWSEVGIAADGMETVAYTAACGFESNDRCDEDAALIVAAVNALPGLLDRLERVEGAAQRILNIVDPFSPGHHVRAECVAIIRDALLPSPSPQQPDGHDHTRESEDQG
jgi:hypothetical protein